MPQTLVYTEPPARPADVPLRIYSNPICPFVQRVKLVAAAKGVQTDLVDVHLKDKPQWYLDNINPHGQVPTIEHNGHLIRESLIGFDYIDEVFGGVSVWPSDPYKKAMARLFVNDFGNKFIPNFYKVFMSDGSDDSPLKALVGVLEGIEEVLKKNGANSFIGGEEGKPSAPDFLAWPWLERVSPLVLLNEGAGSTITKEKFPVFWDYVERMKNNEAVKQSYLPPEAHVAFYKAMKDTGAHDYGTVDIHGTGITIYAGKKN